MLQGLFNTLADFTSRAKEGKSSSIAALLSGPPYRTMRKCGILALANAEKTAYTLKDLVSGEERLAMTTEEKSAWRRLGRFFWDREAFAWANERIIASLGACQIAVFDEIGRLELAGDGRPRICASTGHRSRSRRGANFRLEKAHLAIGGIRMIGSG